MVILHINVIQSLTVCLSLLIIHEVYNYSITNDFVFRKQSIC